MEFEENDSVFMSAMSQKLFYRLVGLTFNLWGIVSPKSAAHGAYRLFGRPPKPNLRPKELQFIDTARQVRCTVAGYPVVEYHWGPENGEMILLCYGWRYNAGRWRHYVPVLLNAGYRVIAYDPPGHGLNSGRFCNVILNSEIQEGLIGKYGRPAAVLAHSFGGASAVRAISRLSPEIRPKRAVIMASFSHAARLFEAYRDAIGLWPGVYDNLVREVEVIVGKPLEDFDFAKLGSGLHDVQTLLVHDPNDDVTPFSNALRYHAYWPGSRLLRAHGGGHHLGLAGVTGDVLRFLVEGKVPDAAEEFTSVPPDQVPTS